MVHLEDYPKLRQKKIAIVHDALVVQAGSERFTLYLSETFPDAPIYTSAYLPWNTFPEFKNKNIITLPFASLVKSEKQFKGLFPWWYLGMSSLDLRKYDIVISSANYLSKYINPPHEAKHVCYMHNPFRFLWKPDVYSTNSVPYNAAIIRSIKLLLPILRKIDRTKTRKIRYLLTNSQNTARQIQRVYNIDPTVIYPPISADEYLQDNQPGDYYLYTGRLISHKRVDLAIEACGRLARKLIIAGDGLDRPVLEKMASDHVEFLGRVPEKRLKELYANCRALIFPSDEDLGLVPVEAQASGRPVIAYQSGGALETVIENETGVFFSEQTVDSLVDAVIRFEGIKFSSAVIRENAKRFDVSVFRKCLLDYLSEID